jgi:membrane-associated phospholipid phosphatase
MNKLKFFSFFVLLTFIFIDFSFGQIKSSNPFNLDFNREVVIIGTGAVAVVTAYAIMENIKPFSVEEIGLLDPANVNGFDRGAIGPLTEDHVGDVLLYTSYMLPISFMAYRGTRNDILDLTCIYGELLLIQASINGIVKGTVQRTRPFVYDDETPIDKKTSIDAKISFFSGHTSMTAAISFFTAKVFTEYIDDNTVKILIWSGAAILPAVVAISRVNTHWHFPTDVMAGYAVGALIGYFIPELHKTKVNGNLSIYPSININKPMLSLQIKF